MSAVKLTFEIGHSASRKTKPSKEGFTHDWELFVKGSDGNDIGHFVEKVVFNLHESFPKPKRVMKEPPYTVKEAGYAGFVLKIDIYLKNRDEPKKVTFDYDLDLQPIKTQINEITVQNPADDFKRKCLKGGGMMLPPGDYKNRDSYNKIAPIPQQIDIKKPSKRPEETKPNKIFTDLFGAPLKKPDPRSLQNSSPNPTKLPAVSSSKAIEKVSSSSGSGSKEKSEKSKHKHSPNKDGKEVKKEVKDSEKPKKDKTKDRERSEKKEKTSKRPSSPSPSSNPASSSSVRTTTANPASLPASKNDLVKPHSKQSSTPVPPSSESSFSKKSSKKDKKSHEKERERSEKKESRAKETSTAKEKPHFDAKEREVTVNREENTREKTKTKVPVAPVEPKTTAPIEVTKKQHDKDSERKHKHKKKEKSKDSGRESGSSKKEKQHKNSTTIVTPPKPKEQLKYEPPKNLSEKDSSDSDVDSPPSIKQDSDNSISDTIMQKPPPEIEKVQKKPRAKAPEKEEKSRKRKKKDERDSSASPPAAKKKDLSKSPSIQERPSSSDSAAHHSHMNNNNVVESAGSERKISNEYMSELKDLKQKITNLKNNDELQQVVRLIAATGCYEITKSSFDFDLVQLDRGTVQRLQEFFASSS